MGRELAVRSVLEGSVRKSGNRVRITANLVDVTNGNQLWSSTFDRDLTDVFALQDEIARSVVDALKIKLLPGRGPDAAQRRATSPAAYGEYLLGKHLNARQELGPAIAAYQRA